jgi:hypothetical protein
MKKILGLVLATGVVAIGYAGKGNGIGGKSKYSVVVTLDASARGHLTLYENVVDKATGKVNPVPVEGAKNCWAHGNLRQDLTPKSGKKEDRRVPTPKSGTVYATADHAFLAGKYESGAQWANATFYAKSHGEPIGIHGGPDGDSHACIRTDPGCAGEIRRRAEEASSPASSVGKLTSEGNPRSVASGHMTVQVNY